MELLSMPLSRNTKPIPHSNVVCLPFNLEADAGRDLQSEDNIKKQVEKKARSVQFATQVEIHTIKGRADMTPEEVTRIWMDRFDQRENNRDIKNTIFLMRSGLTAKLTEDDYFCPRGLELLVYRKNDERVHRKKSVAIALAMQRVLRKAGTSDPVMIARAYSRYTMPSQQLAHKKALYDHACAARSRDPSKTKT